MFVILLCRPTAKAMDSAYCTDDTISDYGHHHAEQVSVAVEAEEDFVIQDNSGDEDEPEQGQPNEKEETSTRLEICASFAQQAKNYIVIELSSPGFPLAKDQPYTCRANAVHVVSRT